MRSDHTPPDPETTPEAPAEDDSLVEPDLGLTGPWLDPDQIRAEPDLGDIFRG